jgi:hypothetical protein
LSCKQYSVVMHGCCQITGSITAANVRLHI